MQVDIEGEVKGQGILRALESTGFLTQESDPIVTMHVDARNGFIELRCLVIEYRIVMRNKSSE